MNYLKSISLLLLVFLIGCPPSQPPSLRDYGEKSRLDPDRSTVLKNARDRHRGRTCEQEDKNHDCREQCDDIYSRRSFEEDCLEQPTTLVAEFAKIHEFLERPRERELKDIDHQDFDAYLNISIEPLDRLIGRKYDSGDAETLMKWLIENPELAVTFDKEDDDYKTLKSLLEEIKSFSNNDIYKPFVEKIDGSDRLMEIVIDVDNVDIYKWLHGFINEENDDCEDEETSVACFTIYCEIGKEIDDDSAEDWLDSDLFSEYIDEIIDEKINGCAWERPSNRPEMDSEGADCYGQGSSPDPFEDNGDLDEDWVKALCKDLV